MPWRPDRDEPTTDNRQAADAVFVVGPDGGRQLPAPGRQPGRRWPIVLVVAALVGLTAVAIVKHAGDDAASRGPESTFPRPSPSMSLSVSLPSPSLSSALSTSPQTTRVDSTGPSSTARPWPTAPGRCDSEIPVAVLSGVRRLDRPTGLTLVGGSRPSTVALDSGRSTALHLRLAADEYVSELATDPTGTVALIDACTTGPRRVVRLTPDGRQVEPAPPGRRFAPSDLITGGSRVWLSMDRLTDSGDYEPDAAITLAPTRADGSAVTMPKGFIPTAGFGDQIIGNAWNAGSQIDGPIMVYDLASRRVVDRFGSAHVSYAVGAGRVVWVDESCSGRCSVHVRDLTTGHTRTVTAALRSPGSIGNGAAISPDGTMVAFVTYDNPPDPRYTTEHPMGLTAVSVLDTVTGRVTDVPGLELAPKSSPAMKFSADGRWLTMVVASAGGMRVLLWHPGASGLVDAGVVLDRQPFSSAPLLVA